MEEVNQGSDCLIKAHKNLLALFLWVDVCVLEILMDALLDLLRGHDFDLRVDMNVVFGI